jgi:hypothetical protein
MPLAQRARNVAQGRMLRWFRLICGLLAGAQLFFAAGAAQVVFPRSVAQLPRDDSRRQLAADLVGQMLARLDAASLIATAVAVLLALASGRKRLALLPLIAGLCAAISAFYCTPQIHAMRAAGTVATARFGLLHAVSSTLLLIEMILLAAAAFFG